MPDKEIVLTQDGLKNLECELDELKGTKMLEIAERIRVARSFGDISENAEYDEAKNEQTQIATRINQIEALLKNAKIIDENELNTDFVSMGTKVKVMNVNEKKESEFLIVGSTEANPFDGKISNESPVGAALLEKKKGDTVKVQTPGGEIKYKILDIHK